MAQDDHPDLRVLLAQQHRQADALVGASGRHPDVGQDDVGPLALDGLEEWGELATRRHTCISGSPARIRATPSRAITLSSASTIATAIASP
jgi:hypothetical protein